MKKLIPAFALLACSIAFAQAPAGTTARPTPQMNPAAAGGVPAAKAQAKVDARTDGKMDMASMDANGDGMISRKEWNSYHTAMWNHMKPKMRKGMMPMADVQAMMRGGPN